MNLRERRKRHGLEMDEVADAIGVTVSAVSLWETGKKIPRKDNARALAKLYGCSVNDIWLDLFMEGRPSS